MGPTHRSSGPPNGRSVVLLFRRERGPFAGRSPQTLGLLIRAKAQSPTCARWLARQQVRRPGSLVQTDEVGLRAVERTGGGGQRELKGQSRGGCVQQRWSGKSFVPRHKWAARPLAVSEMTGRAGSCNAVAQAAGNAEVVAFVRCRGSGGVQRRRCACGGLKGWSDSWR